MIKLIASDLDGTLLQGSPQVSPEMLELIPQMKASGILFAVASGRQYYSLKNLFSPVWEDLLFICENGALIMQGGQELSADQIPREWGLDLIEQILSHDDCEVLLSGKRQCYIAPRDEAYRRHITEYVKNKTTIVQHFTSVQENFIKISLYRQKGITPELLAEFTGRWGDQMTVAAADSHWIDFTLSNKGMSLKKIGGILDIRPDEMMAFGDNFNDREMLAYVGVAYAMESAHPDLKKLAGSTCSHVEPVIRDVLQGRRRPL